jgi:coenzyme F420-0:L-glutamate ligase/coenzyme F420-1:gamma-L-glutamate ligase
MTVSAVALDGLDEIAPGADLPAALASALERQRPAPPGAVGGQFVLTDSDVIVIAHKIVSKAEGRIRALSDVAVTERAAALARELDKDARHVQVVLDESSAVLRASRGILICVTHHGFVCANAGVDASNVPGEDTVVLLPLDPDDSARTLRRRLRELTGVAPAVIITDSFGRPWRHGQVDVAIGCAGLSPLEDWRGRTDAQGRELKATWIAIADELAAAADLARTKDGRRPVVLIRGAHRHVTAEDGPGVAAIIRPESEDLFR